MIEKILGGLVLRLVAAPFILNRWTLNFMIFFIVLSMGLGLCLLGEGVTLGTLFFYDGLRVSLVVLSL